MTPIVEVADKTRNPKQKQLTQKLEFIQTDGTGRRRLEFILKKNLTTEERRVALNDIYR